MPLGSAGSGSSTAAAAAVGDIQHRHLYIEVAIVRQGVLRDAWETRPLTHTNSSACPRRS